MKILVFTTDVIPLAGLATSGTALRTWGLAEGLKSHGHQVVISVPKTALRGLLKTLDVKSLSASVQQQLDELRLLAFDSVNQGDIVQQVQPDAILCGHWPAMAMPLRPSQPVIVDLAGPHLLERHYQGSANQAGAVLGKLGVVANADYFIVSGPSQRLYFLSYMLRAQVRNPEQRMVTIPMPLNPNVPARVRRNDAPDYPNFVFGGVFLPWQDPSAGLRQTASFIERKQRGALKLIGGMHPHYKIKGGVYEALFAELQKNTRVHTKPLMPFDQFVGELSGCDVAIDLMAWNLERELAMTIRSTTYLWAGVPVIYNDYADLGRIIRQYDAGWCVPANDPAALEQVLESIYSDQQLLEKKSANASRLAKEIFAWDEAVKPLLQILGSRRSEVLREIDIQFDAPDNANLNVDRTSPVEQYFLCRGNGLSRIECRLATHNRVLEDGIKMSLFELSTTPDEWRNVSPQSARKLLSAHTATPAEIQNNEWHVFDINPVPDSAGKVFALRIESEAKTSQQSISPWAVRGTRFPLLKLYHGSEVVPETSLTFRTTCSGSN